MAGSSPDQEYLDTVKFVSRCLVHTNIPQIVGKKEKEAKLQEWLVEYHKEDTTEDDKVYYRDCIIHNIFYLIPHILSTYKMRSVLFEEAIQNMVLSLMTAIDKFDVTRGTKFTSFIPGYTKDAIDKSFRSDTIVKTPSHVRKKLAQEYKDRFTAEEEKEGNNGEVEEEAIIPNKAQFDYEPAWDSTPIDEGVYTDYSPGETEYTDGNGCESEQLSVEEDVISREYMGLLVTAIKATGDDAILTPRERVVIIHRFGIFGTQRMSLEEVAHIFEVRKWNATKEWIFQLEKKAVTKLRKYFSNLQIAPLEF